MISSEKHIAGNIKMIKNTPLNLKIQYLQPI